MAKANPWLNINTIICISDPLKRSYSTEIHCEYPSKFSRQAEVIFQPGNERLSIKQQFKGIDEHDHLVVSTELEGRLPTVPLGSSVQINPYKEIYQYDRNRKLFDQWKGLKGLFLDFT